MIGEDKEMTKTILDHALEIIYLLTGEDYAIVKKEDPIKVNSIAKETIGKTPGLKIIEPSSMYEGIKDKKGTTEKIIRIANKIIQMLTRKVLYTSDDFAVYFSIEEWEYLEEHKDHYKNMILDHQDSRQPMDKETPQPLLTPTKEVKNNYSALSNIKKPVDTCVKRSKESEINIDKDGEFQPENEETEPQLNVLVCNNISSYNLRPKICIKMEPSDEDTQDSVVYKYICTDSPQPLRLPQQGVDYEFNEACYIKAEPADGYDEDSQESEMVGDNSREISQPLSSSNVIVEYDDQNACYINVELDSSEDEDSQESLVAEELDKGYDQENAKMQKNTNPGRTCFECAEKLKTEPHLLTIQGRGNVIDPFSCNVCLKSLKGMGPIEKKQNNHFEKPYPCEICGKRLSNPSSFSRHQKMHTGENPFQCDVCQKSFSCRTHWVVHQRTHTGERPYSCMVCGRRFINNAHLVLHKVVHTGEKPFSCDVCGMRFTRKSSVKKHASLHSDERPHVCKECGKGYSQYANLVIHQRVHSGEKPYVCMHCGRGFICKATMLRHQLTHTREKPYSCIDCNKPFVDKRALNRHKRVHKVAPKTS